MTTYRIERVNKELLRLLSNLLANRVKDARAKEAILTHVDCSRDLGHAKVYYTLIDPLARDATQRALQDAAGLLRGLAGKEMHLRHIPEFHFIYDDSEKKARDMDTLLDRIKSELPESAPIEGMDEDDELEEYGDDDDGSDS